MLGQYVESKIISIAAPINCRLSRGKNSFPNWLTPIPGAPLKLTVTVFNSSGSYVLKQDWQWVNIIKPPKVKSLPDILTVSEIEQLIGATRKLRYRVFIIDYLFHGLASRRNPFIAGRGYRWSTQEGSYPSWKRSQGPFRSFT